MLILGRDVTKIGFVEQPPCLVVGGLGLGYQSLDARALAIEDYAAPRVPDGGWIEYGSGSRRCRFSVALRHGSRDARSVRAACHRH